MGLDLKSNELEHKFMKERVSSIEKHLNDISIKLSSYIKKLASVRDSGDEVAKGISDFASKEIYNQSLRLSLGEFSDLLSSIQEYREAQINRTQFKVIHDLDNFTPVCKLAKIEIKKCFDSREKELKRKTELEKIRGKSPPNWQKIAEKEVNQAQIEAAHATQELSKQLENFERKKIENFKRLFLELVKIEMIFHAKAIELYTKSYNILAKIDVDEDLNEFKSHFKGLNCTLNLACPQTDISQQTIPKVIDTEGDHNLSQQLQVFKGNQGLQRSIFTLKSNTAQIQNSNSSLDSSTSQAKPQAIN